MDFKIDPANARNLFVIDRYYSGLINEYTLPSPSHWFSRFMASFVISIASDLQLSRSKLLFPYFKHLPQPSVIHLDFDFPPSALIYTVKGKFCALSVFELFAIEDRQTNLTLRTHFWIFESLLCHCFVLVLCYKEKKCYVLFVLKLLTVKTGEPNLTLRAYLWIFKIWVCYRFVSICDVKICSIYFVYLNKINWNFWKVETPASFKSYSKTSPTHNFFLHQLHFLLYYIILKNTQTAGWIQSTFQTET